MPAHALCLPRLTRRALLRPPAMGQPDQFAKRTFAQETEPLTHGAVIWKDPPEISLTKVQGDGRLVVRDPGRLPPLDPPWTEVRGHDEIPIEIKMAGDHLDLPAIERILLRRQARQVERVEVPKTSWRGQVPVWAIAPHIPEILGEIWKVSELAPGCYRVGPSVYSFLWIAANELPLRDDLVPFLVARSGRALDEFGRWVATRRPVDWVLDMVQYTAMSTKARAEVIQDIDTDDPAVWERRRHIVELFLPRMPDLERALKDKGRDEGRLVEARTLLRRVLARRGLPLSAEEGARIDACTALATVERWLEEAAVASSTAEALRLAPSA